MTLHILILDKFTKPFYHHLTKVLNIPEQQFLVVADGNIGFGSHKNLFQIKSPIRKNFLYNLKLFYKLSFKANRIILHGAPVLFFFTIFPRFLKKSSWIIYGQELYNLKKEKGLSSFVNRFVFSKVKNHITHIKGDSDLANELLSSKAKFVYSPMYLSNVVDTNQFKPISFSEKKQLKVLVGNSTDPTNNHEKIFRQLYKFKEEIECIYCPLSYGSNKEYKNKIIEEGHKLFGAKFIPLENFMAFEEYKKFLESIDVAVFDHNRQQGMGVTLTLLSLGKIVYVNSQTTSYNSLMERGCQVYNNELIELEGLKKDREVHQNKVFLEKYYSVNVFNESILAISKL